MAKNKLSDLNNHLFAQLERLGDENLKDDELKEEISRAKAISEVSKQVIDNGKLIVSAGRLKVESNGALDFTQNMTGVLNESTEGEMHKNNKNENNSTTGIRLNDNISITDKERIEFAKHLGYKTIDEAITEMTSWKFEEKLKVFVSNGF